MACYGAAVLVGVAMGTQTPWYSFLSAECRDQDAGKDPCDRCDAKGEMSKLDYIFLRIPILSIVGPIDLDCACSEAMLVLVRKRRATSRKDDISRMEKLMSSYLQPWQFRWWCRQKVSCGFAFANVSQHSMGVEQTVK